MLSRRLKVSFAKLERAAVSFVLADRRSPQWYYACAICILIILFAFVFEVLHTNAYQLPDIFFIPLIISAIVFRYYGLFFILPAIVARYMALYGNVLPSSLTLVNEVFVVFKWLILVVITVFAFEKFRSASLHEIRFKHDLDMAKILQRTLLPKLFQSGKVRINGYIRQSMQIGGDFYYFRPFKQKYAMLAIGDVMGKGIAASIAMAIIMGFLYEWRISKFLPSKMMRKINHRLINLWGQSQIFSTIFYGIINIDTYDFTYANAGHQHAVLVGWEGKAQIIEGSGVPVGMYSEADWDDYHLSLSEGDKLILFTDGICETKNDKNEQYSVDRLISVAEVYRHESGERLRMEILNSIQKFAGRKKMTQSDEDDRAIVILEIME